MRNFKYYISIDIYNILLYMIDENEAGTEKFQYLKSILEKRKCTQLLHSIEVNSYYTNLEHLNK